MLQIVSIITLILLGASAMFAWLQNRSSPESSKLENPVSWNWHNNRSAGF